MFKTLVALSAVVLAVHGRNLYTSSFPGSDNSTSGPSNSTDLPRFNGTLPPFDGSDSPRSKRDAGPVQEHSQSPSDSNETTVVFGQSSVAPGDFSGPPSLPPTGSFSGPPSFPPSFPPTGSFSGPPSFPPSLPPVGNFTGQTQEPVYESTVIVYKREAGYGDESNSTEPPVLFTEKAHPVKRNADHHHGHRKPCNHSRPPFEPSSSSSSPVTSDQPGSSPSSDLPINVETTTEALTGRKRRDAGYGQGSTRGPVFESTAEPAGRKKRDTQVHCECNKQRQAETDKPTQSTTLAFGK